MHQGSDWISPKGGVPLGTPGGFCRIKEKLLRVAFYGDVLNIFGDKRWRVGGSRAEERCFLSKGCLGSGQVRVQLQKGGASREGKIFSTSGMLGRVTCGVLLLWAVHLEKPTIYEVSPDSIRTRVITHKGFVSKVG